VAKKDQYVEGLLSCKSNKPVKTPTASDMRKVLYIMSGMSQRAMLGFPMPGSATFS